MSRLAGLKPRADCVAKLDKTPAEKIREFISRAAPPGPDDVLAMLDQLRTVLSDSGVDRLEHQLWSNVNSVQNRCSVILQAEEILFREAGGPPPDYRMPTHESAPLVTESEIKELEDRIKELEVTQQKNNRKEQDLVEAEQQRVREVERQRLEAERRRLEGQHVDQNQEPANQPPASPPHSGSGRRPDPTNQLAISLIEEHSMNEGEAIREAIQRDERVANKKLPFAVRRANVKEAILYHRSKKQPQNPNP
jgi:hypothetical protein